MTTYVYLQPGDKLYLGTGIYVNTDYDVMVTSPSGAATTYNVEKDGVGFIQNRTQELAGPRTLNSSGYNPITYTASAEGIYTVLMRKGTGHGSADCFVAVDADWSACYDTTDSNPAWDLTVANSSGQKKNGRAFLSMFLFNSGGELYSSFYILTDTAFQYKVSLNGGNAATYAIRSNNMGNVVNGRAAYTSYINIPYSEGTGYSVWYKSDFTPAANGGVSHRLLYNPPDSALLTYLGMPSNGTPLTPNITDFKFTGTNSSDSTTYQSNGGTFTFKSNLALGKYILTLTFSNGKQYVVNGEVKTNNTVSWNGKDSEGNVAPAGAFTAEIKTLPGEMHIVFEDFEEMAYGIIFQRINGSASDRYKVYYDHSHKVIDGYSNKMDRVTPEINAQTYTTPRFGVVNGWTVDLDNQSMLYLQGELNRTDGVDSSGGVSATRNHFPDQRCMDFWTYGDVVRLTTTGTIRSEEKISVVVQKTWSDQNNKFSLRSTSLVFDAFAGSSTSSSGNCTANASSSWKCTISGLYKYDLSGNVITYTIRERNVPSAYTATSATVTAGSGASAGITNTLKVRNVIVSKIWTDYNNKFSLRPANIVFDVFVGSGTTSMGNCTANAESSWKCTITGLPTVDNSGNAIIYTFKERNTPQAYTATTSTVNNASATSTSITNTLVTKSISVKKTWNDGSNQDGIRPESIKFDLYCGTTKCGDNPYTITSANNWTITVPNIPVYDSNGQVFTYSVVEEDF